MINLNKEQRRAVESKNKFNLVIAGAGTGKTTVLINRILYLLFEKNIDADKLAVLTFSNRAADEIKNRIRNKGIYLDYTGTFHSFAMKVISEFNIFGYYPELLLPEEKEDFFEKSVVSLKIKKKYIRVFLEQIEKLKRNSLYYDELVVDKSNEAEILLKEAFKLYEDALKKTKKIDYENMILLLFRELKVNVILRKKFKNKFSHVLIDEFQDTSLLQINLLKEMTKINPDLNIFAVGDDDQSVYGFRDARVDNILNFNKVFIGAEVIKLTQNYRSGKNIVEIANKLIKNNKLRFNKFLINEVKEKGFIEKKIFYSQEEEKNYIISKIKELESTGCKQSDIAVILRYNKQIKELAEFFKENSLKFITSLNDEERFETEFENSGDGIRLITYHGAKGLEFKNVFLPYLADEIFLGFDFNREDERRLFYVGITRAQKRLFLSYSVIVNRFGRQTYVNELRFLNELSLSNS